MRKLSASWIAILGLTVAMLALTTADAWACPNCKEALAANSRDGSDLVRGYFYSILFMMGMPFTIVGAFSFSMYRAVKRAQAQAASADEHRSDDQSPTAGSSGSQN